MAELPRITVVTALLMNACAAALRFYTRRVPFRRGRGLFIRIIEYFKRRGWPPPLIRIGNGGLVMEFEPSLLGWTLFERGEWEPEQTDVVQRLLKPGAVVINVGANTGYYALLTAAVVGRAGHVHAFEIQPAMLEILSRNVRRNGLDATVTIVAKGCFSSAGKATIEQRGDPGSARVSLHGKGIEISLITLDAYVAAVQPSRIDLILIDAEGADFEILKGAKDVLARYHPFVIAETHHLGAFGGSEDETLRIHGGNAVHGERAHRRVFARHPIHASMTTRSCMAELPDITVVTPSFHQGAFLEAALRRERRIVRQRAVRESFSLELQPERFLACDREIIASA
jgi:FkbM family methyltransferase